jgi:hypothetical protein
MLNKNPIKTHLVSRYAVLRSAKSTSGPAGALSVKQTGRGSPYPNDIDQPRFLGYTATNLLKSWPEKTEWGRRALKFDYEVQIAHRSYIDLLFEIPRLETDRHS